MTYERDGLDRLARRFAGGDAPAGEDALLSRGSVLRLGALGVLTYAFGGLPDARAAVATVAGCPGGSLAACNRSGQKTYKATLAFCNKVYNDQNDPFGMSRYACWVESTSARFQGRKDCRSKCSKEKPPKGGGSGGGGGGGAGGGGGDNHTPTCGYVDCVEGDKCCPVKGGGDVCCAVGCAKSGDGCCSSDSDC